ncbi:SusC/RagA family TonB-linked outer membrane protein [Hymenobacter sp. DG25A]|uniref:SusC/RagA family TonB-linked outer membrane protein n=1 Tax=Hymenobacter sp. DG25A TaxID=1385663 RepID=UPI0006BC2C0A|nr:SusC/RagA family TonB-linked outer membrane protein [Hymenobacter sp. DG25A]ALD22366.1 hypothetical protein AM218_15565 [Hymenobacter sp. DG25A]
MPQLLPLISLLFIAPVALAQQVDSLVFPPAIKPGRIITANAALPDTAAGHSLIPGTPFQEQLRQVAGVQVTPYSGAPGAPAVVRIRGAASMGRNVQPLYVLDGLPVWQHHTQIWQDQNPDTPPYSYELNPTLTLAPEDILSLEILKGAYETAEYGAQGMNGVIRITTRNGQNGKPRLTYNGYGGVQQARFRYNLLNAPEYAGLVNEAAANFGGDPKYTPEQIAAFGQGTDWQRELLRTAGVHHQQVALQGGKGRTVYYTSAAYGQQQGILQNSRLRSFNLRATVEHQFTPKLMLRGTLSTSEQQARLLADNLTTSMVLAVPTQPARTVTGELAEPELNFNNPLREALLTYRTPRQRYLLGQLHLRYTVLPFLTLEMRGSEEHINQKMTGYQASWYSQPAGRVLEQEAEYRQWTVLPAMRFHHTFGRHQVQVGVAAQRQSQQQDQARQQYRGEEKLLNYYGSHMPYRLTAYHLTGSYQWKERYEANLSLRRDAMLLPFGGKNLQYLPAAQVKWHAGREAWLQQLPLLSTLEAWAGWGHTSNAGQFATGAYLMQAVPGSGGFSYRYLPLDELTRQQEVGLTMGLWQDRLTLSSTAYHRNTRVLGRPEIIFGNMPTPATPTYGQLRNRGLELTATGQWQAGRLRGITSLSAAFNQNRFQADELENYRSNQNQQIRDGHPLSTFYTLQYTGPDTNGLPRYVDVNQDGRFNYEDGQDLGSGLPHQLLSMGQNLQVGRFRLQAQLDGMFGYQQQTSYLYLLNSANTYTNSTRNTLNYWTPENPTATVPRLGAFPRMDSDFTLQSGNHVRLTSLTAHYKLWEKDSRSLTLWAGGHNLLVLSKYRGFDPNVSSAGADSQQAGLDNGAYPTARTFLLGVQATL